MSHQKLFQKIVCVAVCLCIVIIYVVLQWRPNTSNDLSITMLDIGQGDAFYIRTPSGVDLLIDGGPDRRILDQLGAVMPPLDHTIDYVIATHPDADHIAGLAELPGHYDVRMLLTNGMTKDTAPARQLLTWPRQIGTQVQTVQRGQHLQLDADTWLEFLHPDPGQPHPQDSNSDSIVCILHYKQASALFTGDATQETEATIIDYAQHNNITIDVDLLKVGHHGSRSSTSPQWLAALTPSIGLISIGADNRYGHPHAAPLYWLNRYHVQMFRTDLQGRVLCRSGGEYFVCQ
jgi:competence protein ComEC